MTNQGDRDEVVARALDAVATPDHLPGFWEDLDAAMDQEDGATTPRVVRMTGRRRTNRRRFVLPAAAAAAVLALLAVVTTSQDGDNTVRVVPTDRTPDPTAPATSTAPPTTVADVPGATNTGKSTPDGAVIAWLEALGAGQIDAATALVGPRTEAYYKALGGNVRGAMVESQEGFGAWADSPDRSTTEVGLGPVDGVEMTVVVVMGTRSGEGEDGYRTDAIPVIRSGRGNTWLVEPAAFAPKAGGRLELIRPSAGESGLNGLAADATLEAGAPGSGNFWFSLDDAPPTQVPGRRVGSGVRGTFDPPGQMRSQSHLLVVAYVDGATFTAFAGVFAVEG